MKRLLCMALVAAAAVVLSGCPTTPVRAPKDAPESIEMVELLGQHVVDGIDSITCNRSNWDEAANQCKLPGFPVSPDTGLGFIDKVEEARTALKAVSVGSGGAVQCLGAQRTPAACIAAARAAIVNADAWLRARQNGGIKP